jgi:pyruvate kinase
MMQIYFNKTKIVATVGPASNTYETLVSLIREGVDVFRLNFSHGTHADHSKVIETVRQINKEHKTNICLMQDLQGPKIRLGDVEGGSFEIIPEQRLKIICADDEPSVPGRLTTIYKGLAKDVRVGDQILIDDGKIELRVVETDHETEVTADVIYGGTIKPRKGINLPNSKVSAPSLTEKDLKDLEFGLDNDVEWVALSFVRKVEDIVHLREIIDARGKDTKIIAKIEKPEAIKNIDGIMQVCDAIMVARGDLGVEVGMEEVPMIQKMLVEKANCAGKPVIIATQMMESMITAPRPTRAETNDIANAVMDGADALMLSAETASGQYPVETIRSMNKTIRSVEDHADIFYRNFVFNPQSENFYNDSLVANAVNLCRDTEAVAIVGLSKSGYTAFQLAKHRPKANLFIFTDSRRLLNVLNLLWGVRGFYYNKFNDSTTDETVVDIKRILLASKHVKQGDVFISTSGMPTNAHKKTNMIKLSIV